MEVTEEDEDGDGGGKEEDYVEEEEEKPKKRKAASSRPEETTTTNELPCESDNTGSGKKNYICTMCPKQWRGMEGNINSKIIHWHILPVHFKSEMDMEIKAVFSENMCSFCGTHVGKRIKKASHLYSKHNTFKEEVKMVAKAIATNGKTTSGTSKSKSEKKTGHNKNLKNRENPEDAFLAADDEKEAELIQASLMMLQDISDSEEDDDA